MFNFKKGLLFLVLSSSSALGFAGSVSVFETFDATTQRGEYTVHNNSGEAIYALFVGNNMATQADKGENPNLISWRPDIVSRELWEAGKIPFPDNFGPVVRNLSVVGEPIIGDIPSWTPPDTTQLDWDTYIGSQYDQAVGYWTDGFGEVPQIPLADGSVNDGFLFYSAQPASPFVVFGATGNVVATGEASVVPVPAAFWLFGTALLGLLGAKAKKTVI